MDEKLTCPYCGEEQETHIPDEISNDMVFSKCEYCGKNFWYSVIVTREYYSLTEDGERGRFGL